MNTLQDIEDRYTKSITALKSLEQILKTQETTYENHIARLGWLKHLADASMDLKKLESEFLKVTQAAAAQAARQQQVQPTAQVTPQVAPQPVEQEPEQEESTPKKVKKKL